jgi:DNA-binding transcriptional LysR family regulator
MTTKQITGNQINWNQVFYFSEVARLGSLKAASESLDLTASTLSEHISQLEKELQIKLFNREHRKLTLTHQGERLFQHARQMFEAGQRLIDVVSPIPLGKYPISIGLVPAPSMHAGYSIIFDLISAHKNISFKIHQAKTRELEDGLSAARFDVGFSPHPPENRDLISHCILATHLTCYVSAEHSGKTFSALKSELPFLFCSAEPEHRHFAEALNEEGNSRSIVSSDYPGITVELCQKGLGIGILSEDFVRQLNRKAVRSLTVPKGSPHFTDRIYALWSKDGENSEAVQLFKRLIPNRT